MYYITKRSSETGKKIMRVFEKINEAIAAQKVMAEKYLIKKWRPGRFLSAGGFSSVIFDKNVVVDKSVWKNVFGVSEEWMPKLSSKEGKKIQSDFDTLPVVTNKEVNSCVDTTMDHFVNRIGITQEGSKEFYGIRINEDTAVKMPNDCTEVTFTEYKKLFNGK